MKRGVVGSKFEFTVLSICCSDWPSISMLLRTSSLLRSTFPIYVYNESVIRVSQESYKSATRVARKNHKSVTRESQECHRSVTRVLHEYYRNMERV
jgi:hypothetical protein